MNSVLFSQSPRDQSFGEKKTPSKHVQMLRQYPAISEDLWPVSFLPKGNRNSWGSNASLNQLHWLLDTTPTAASVILGALKDTRADTCSDCEKTCATDSSLRDYEEALALYKDSSHSTKQAFKEEAPSIEGRIGSMVSRPSELGQQQTESWGTIVGEAWSNNEIAGTQSQIVNMLLRKLWTAWQDTSTTYATASGADGNSMGQQSRQRGSEHKIGQQQSSKPSQKRPHQPPQPPESDEDRDPKRPEARRRRGRNPRVLNEFGCPFFKHDPEKHSGRGGCRDYSHKDVSILLRDHIGLKHLRNNDLDANMLHELKTTKHLKGAERYKAIYAKLFPGDELGIRNPYFDEYNVPSSWHERAQLFQKAGFVTAAVECLESFERLEQDRVEKDVQIRQDAERDLNQAQTDLAAQMEPLQAAANQRQQQIRTSRDERLKEVEADMAQRRREIRARIDSIVFSQASNPSTTANVTSAMDHEVVASNDTDRIARTEAKRPPPTVADSVPNITIGQLPISGNQFLAAGEPRLTTIARAPMLHDNFWLDANPQVDSVGVGLWKTDQKQTQPTPNSYHLADEEGLPPSEHICCGCCGQDDAAFCFACLGDHC